MASYTFSNTSGYENALDQLKTQIKAITDDTPTAIFTDNNIFDYTPNMNIASSQGNYPLCILKIGPEEMKTESRQNSNLVIEMYHVFNNNDKDFGIIFNQIISTFRLEFLETYNNTFEMLSIDRDKVPNELSAELNKFKPFWAVKYTINYNNVKY